MSTIAQLPTSAERMYQNTTIRADEQGVYATARWKCLYSDLWRMFTVIGGLPEPSGWGSRIVPLLFPDVPEEEPFRLYAYNINTTTSGVDPDTDLHKWAFLDVDFKTFNYDFDGDQAFISESYKGSVEIITRPGSAYTFPSDSRRVNQEVGVLVPGTEFSLTFHRLPSLNYSLYESLQGRVNSTAFVPSYYNIAAGHVQYLAPGMTVETTVGGVRSYSLTHTFRSRYIPINEIMRGDGTGFEAPEDANGDPIYPVADLNALFS